MTYSMSGNTMQVFVLEDAPDCIKEVLDTEATTVTTYYNCKKGVVTSFEEVFLKTL
jgi:hypothetical protein